MYKIEFWILQQNIFKSSTLRRSDFYIFRVVKKIPLVTYNRKGEKRNAIQTSCTKLNDRHNILCLKSICTQRHTWGSCLTGSLILPVTAFCEWTAEFWSRPFSGTFIPLSSNVGSLWTALSLRTGFFNKDAPFFGNGLLLPPPCVLVKGEFFLQINTI